MERFVDVHSTDGVASITLNRPDKANALTADMLVDLHDAVQTHQDAKVLILTGAGRVFSAGADLDQVADTDLATHPIWEHLSQAIYDFPGLTVARMNGTVAGGAMGMVLACDVRVCVPATKFFYPVLAKGVDPQPSDVPRMTQLVGPARTAEVFLLGRKISAETARAWGLVHDLVADDLLDDHITAMIASALSARSGAVARIKRQIKMA